MSRESSTSVRYLEGPYMFNSDPGEAVMDSDIQFLPDVSSALSFLPTYDNATLGAHSPIFHGYAATTDYPLIAGLSRDQIDPDMMIFRKVVHLLDLYLVPAVAVIGILGNTVSFLVFVGTYLRRMSSSIYLAGLSVSDTLFLLVMLISWANNVGWDIHHRTGWCQLFVYLAYISSFLSVWYVVSFTLERYLAVKFPLKRQTMCTPGRAKLVTIFLAVLAAVLYNYSLWTSGLADMYQRPFCVVLPRYYHTVHIISNVDTFITLIIPTIIIITSNVQIAYALTKFYRSRTRLDVQAHMGSAPSASGSTSADCSVSFYSNSSYNRLQMKVTKMLLIVSTVFLLCNIPSHAIRVYAFAVSLADPTYKPSHRFLLVQKVMQFIFYTNFASNFFLYSLSGRTFRKATVRLFHCIRQRMTNFIRGKYTWLRSRSRSRSRARSRSRSRTRVTRSELQLRVLPSDDPAIPRGFHPVSDCEKYS